jgi:hypothetical protein
MGVWFHSTGCVKYDEACCVKSRAINPNGSPHRATKDKEKPAGVNRRAVFNDLDPNFSSNRWRATRALLLISAGL